MSDQIEYLHDTFPNGLPWEHLFDGNALYMCGLHAVKFTDHVHKFPYIGHAAASTKSLTLQNDCSTPAAMAGVQRSVL